MTALFIVLLRGNYCDSYVHIHATRGRIRASSNLASAPQKFPQPNYHLVVVCFAHCPATDGGEELHAKCELQTAPGRRKYENYSSIVYYSVYERRIELVL